MANVDWMIRGLSLSTCNCDWGCPCQFNALPTRGNCRAAVAMKIDEGHFGDTDLSGVKWCAAAAWPGAIHEGHGEIQAVVDESASEDQRNGILTILSGRETEPGTTIFSVFAAVLETVHHPLFLPIEFEGDFAAGTGRFSVPGFVTASLEPIRNPVTGEAHRARVTLPRGFEYHVAEYASSTVKATTPIELDWSGRHAHLAMMHMTPTGPVHA
jgi:hypothetical protein